MVLLVIATIITAITIACARVQSSTIDDFDIVVTTTTHVTIPAFVLRQLLISVMVVMVVVSVKIMTTATTATRNASSILAALASGLYRPWAQQAAVVGQLCGGRRLWRREHGGEDSVRGVHERHPLHGGQLGQGPLEAAVRARGVLAPRARDEHVLGRLDHDARVRPAGNARVAPRARADVAVPRADGCRGLDLGSGAQREDGDNGGEGRGFLPPWPCPPTTAYDKVPRAGGHGTTTTIAAAIVVVTTATTKGVGSII